MGAGHNEVYFTHGQFVLIGRNFHYIYIKIQVSEFRQLKTKRRDTTKGKEKRRERTYLHFRNPFSFKTCLGIGVALISEVISISVITSVLGTASVLGASSFLGGSFALGLLCTAGLQWLRGLLCLRELLYLGGCHCLRDTSELSSNLTELTLSFFCKVTQKIRGLSTGAL
jgi:hypothetical protein